MPDYSLPLSADEVMCLSDRVANDDHNTDDMRVASYPLLLKLGSVFVELVGDGTKQSGEIPLVVTEAELWLIRSKVKTGDKSASDPLFGVKLLAKVYRGLLALNGAGELPTTEEESPADRAQTVARLQSWAERKDVTDA